MTRFGVPTPRDKPVVSSRKAEKPEKKWSLKGWDLVKEPADDGITGWMKRQSLWETKRGKKRPAILDSEFYWPVSKSCSEITEWDVFKKDSLHERFHRKAAVKKITEPAKDAAVLKYTSTPRPAPVETESTSMPSVVSSSQEDKGKQVEQNVVADNAQVEDHNQHIKEYRECKSVDDPHQEHRLIHRSKSVAETHHRPHDHDRNGPKTTVYHRIKRILKFSKFGETKRQPSNVDEEEDEGYWSKTSSAEAKETKDESRPEYPGFHRMCTSMIDLSELASQERLYQQKIQRIKFSYTHQGANSPGPPDTDRSRREEVEDAYRMAVRLQRVSEPPNCSHVPVSPAEVEDTTVYSLETLKPMTLVLRKISIQDADQNLPERVTAITLPAGTPDRPASQASSRPGSRANSRIGSADRRRHGNSRPTSYHSGSDPQTPKPQNKSLWSPQASVYDRAPTSYCFGDLLPAMDRSIYNMQNAGRAGSQQPQPSNERPVQRVDASTEYVDPTKVPRCPRTPHAADDNEEYMLLKRGMDLLSGAIDKPTLGPPAFRPNQTRHPLTRNVTVVLDNKGSATNPFQYQLRSSPTHGTNRRTGSDKGPRPQQSTPDKETRKKLKEAFTRFYDQRPKDIGKEFRRMQTMWNT